MDEQNPIFPESVRTENPNVSQQNNSNNMEIHRVSIKPVQFIKTQPKLYFLQMEAQFSLANITRDLTKYNHILGTLEPTYLTSVMDIIENPPLANKYEAIKNRIIGEFQQSDQHKLRILLRETELGDLKPSQLLRKMRELSNNSLNDDALKTLWIERLPEQIRPVISISNEALNNVALMADKMLEITSYNVISEVAAPDINRELANQIAVLSKRIDNLTKNSNTHSNNRGRSQSRERKNDRKRASTPSNNDSPYCYYHFKFGAMARKCREPCIFESQSSDQTSKN